MRKWDSGLYDESLERPEHEPLSFEQEQELAKLARNGDEVARERMINANLLFVNTVAGEMQGSCPDIEIEDLKGYGRIGLINALDRFDPDKGFKFITYAVWWIKQSMRKAQRDHARTIRLPGSVQRSRQELERMEEMGWDDDMMGEFVSDTQRRTVELTDFRYVKLDAEAYQEGLDTYHEQIADDVPLHDALFADADMSRKLRAVMENALDPRECEVLVSYFDLDNTGAEMTLGEIGLQLHVTRERVRQIKARALGKLRRALERQKFGALTSEAA